MGNLRFKIDWASLIAGSKFTVFVLFYFVFEGNFPSTNHRGGGVLSTMAWEGRLRPEGAPFSGFRVLKGQGFHLFK